MGIELKGISFGAMLGGSLSVLRLAARLERFDLANLLLCQISAGKTLDGQSVKEVHRSYIFDNILALMPTAAPVPIPIFYDALGISYRGWDGLAFETRWRFPAPEAGFLEVIDLIKRGATPREGDTSMLLVHPERSVELLREGAAHSG